eukprot:3092647-Rhodomonas_salina.2
MSSSARFQDPDVTVRHPPCPQPLCMLAGLHARAFAGPRAKSRAELSSAVWPDRPDTRLLLRRPSKSWALAPPSTPRCACLGWNLPSDAETSRSPRGSRPPLSQGLPACAAALVRSGWFSAQSPPSELDAQYSVI